MADHFISREQAEQNLLDCSAFLAERIRSRDGHAEAMKVIVPLYLANGEVDLAAELANALDDPFSRDQLLIEVAVKCAEADDDDYALQLAEAIEDHGLQAQALERIGLIVASKGNTDRAGQIAELMGHPDFVYAGIAVHEASVGGQDSSREMIDNIEFPTARVQALQQIAAGQIDSGETEKGIETLLAAVAETENIEHDEEHIRTLCELSNIFLDAKANDKAIETFDEAKTLAESLDNRHRDFFLVTCAVGFLNSGSLELADRTLDLVADKTQMASAMVGFSRYYWGRDEKDEAIDALEEGVGILKSQRDNEIRDSKARNGLLTTFAAQFAGFGKVERGVDLALENPDPDQRTKSLIQIAQILTTQNEPALARDTLTSIDNDADRMFALISVADAQVKLGKNEEAVATLDEALTLAETVEQLSSRSDALNEIADRFARLDQTERARDAALENMSLAGEIRDESSRAAAVANLAAVYQRSALDYGERELSAMRRLTSLIPF